MSRPPSNPFTELRRRNVLRAAALYAGAVWALAQGISQLTPAMGLPDAATRWFLIAAIIGFPFWIAFAWFYEWTSQGLKRESEIAADASITRSTGRRLDRAIIVVLALAVVLLLTNTFVWHKGSGISGGAAAIPDKSIAVLPLSNESGDKDQQYFSDGLSEDLITALSQFSGLKVIARNSSFKFRNSRDSVQTIARTLGVAHLLEGSVQRAGDVVRVSATLINASDGTAMWSQHYDRPYKDLFALQDDITRQVAVALKAKLLVASGAVIQSDRPPSGSVAAFAAFQRGNAYVALNSEDGYRQAIVAYDEATRLDPRYAAAYAKLSAPWLILSRTFLGGSEGLAASNHAREAVDSALRLDPNLASAHLARAQLLLNLDMNWTGAEAEAMRALQLAPNDAAMQFNYANVSATMGQLNRAVQLTRHALQSDPLHADWYYWLSAYLTSLGQLDAARNAIETAIALQPGAEVLHLQLAVVEIQRGDAAAALAAARQEPPGLWRDIALAQALQLGADRATADASLQTLVVRDADMDAVQIAETYALRRDPDAMFKWLDRAWTQRDPGLVYFLYDPLILRYQHDPRFAAFASKVGLPTTTDAKGLP